MITLKATQRKKEDNLKEARIRGLVPAVLYGEKLKNQEIFVEEKPFLAVFQEAGETSIIELSINEKEKYQALIHAIDRDSLSGRIIHLDFFHPSLKKKITAEVPLVFLNEAPAVKDLGLILEKEMLVLPVKGLVKDLPHEIEVDLSTLKTLEDKILIKDLKIPSAVEILHHGAEDIIAQVKEPKKEQEPAPEPTEGEKEAGETTEAEEGAAEKQDAQQQKK